MNIKNEKLFVEMSKLKSEPNEIGRKQFFDHQSKGESPINPNPYFLVLTDGKDNFDFLCSEYHKMWMSGDWPGFRQVYTDWKGRLWVLPYLCKWFGELPEWVMDEDHEADDYDVIIA